MDKKYLYGLDISLKCTGVAIYDLIEKKFVYIGSFNTEKIKATKEYKGLYLNGLKLKKLMDYLKEKIKDYPPAIVSMERGYSRFNNETQVLFRAHGCVNCLFWNKPQDYFPPKLVKSTIYHGDASKDEVKDEILKRYPNLVMNNEDESDAVAVALTYLIDRELISWEKTDKPSKKPRKKKSEE